MTIAFLMVFGGLVFLVAGGEGLVRGAVALAERFCVPPLIISLTLVAFGTSVPELMIAIQAGLGGNADIAIGNVVGSNIANILLVLGATILVRPIMGLDESFMRDSLVMLMLSVALIAMAMWGEVTRLFGGLLVSFLLVYVLYIYYQGSKLRHEKVSLSAPSSPRLDAKPMAAEKREVLKLLSASLFFIIGLAAVIFGADILVDGAVILAKGFGVPESIIGLSLVAIGTSLPELAISVLAAFRGQPGIAIGNVVGSNIFNIGLVLGVTGLITPLPVDAQIAGFDIWVMLAASLVMTWFLYKDARLLRWVGACFLSTYVVYMAFLFIL